MYWNMQSQNVDYDPDLFNRMNILREAVNAYERAYAEVADATKALASDDKDTVWDVYQDYLRQYEERINGVSALTGIHVYRDSEATKDSLSLSEIKQNLKWIANFILQYDALEFAADEETKHAVERFFQANGISVF